MAHASGPPLATRAARQLLGASPIRWRWTVVAIASLAFVLRLLLIAHTHGGSDLRNYTYFSRIALRGADPFTPPPHGLFSPVYANSPPLEYVLFSLLLRVHNSPTTLRILFALADVGVILLIGLASCQRRSWRAAFITFYAFNPLVLISWTVYAEDKTLLFCALTIVFLSIERGRPVVSWLATTFMAAFKFLGAFWVPVLFVDTFRRRRGQAVLLLGCFLVLVVASNVPWLPHSLDSFTRRDQRLDISPPIHASAMLLLARIDLYATWEPRLLTAVALTAVFVFAVAKRTTTSEALALSLFFGYIFLPDDSFDRLLLITLPFLLLIRPTLVQWAIVWATTTLSAIAAAVETRGVPHALQSASGLLTDLFSHEATVRDVLWMNAPLFVILVVYLLQRRRGAMVERCPTERPSSSDQAAPGCGHETRDVSAARGVVDPA